MHAHSVQTVPRRLAWLLPLALLAACERPLQSASGQPAPVAPTAAAPAVDEFQTMAVEAGRGLIGTRAPHLAFATLDGRTVTLGDETVRPVYLKFWATWCTTCLEQMDAFRADHARFGARVDFIAVNTGVNDDPAAVAAYLREVVLPMPVAIDDGQLGAAFHLKVTPQHVVIGRDGIVRYMGHLGDERLQGELQAAIDGGPAAAAPSVQSGPMPRTEPQAAEFAGTFLSVQGDEVHIDGPGAAAPRLVYFLSPWCEGYLAQSRPSVAQACIDTRKALTRASRRGVEVIGIASGLSATADDVRAYLQRTGFTAPVVFDADGRLFRRFGVRSFPAVIPLDAVGRPSEPIDVRDIDAWGTPARAPPRS